MAVQAVRVVMRGDPNVGKLAADLKRYARVEKIPGGGLEDSKVLNGVMVNKDVTHSGMRRYIKNPRVLLLDRTLEYKKGESKTDIEMKTAKDKSALLQEEVNEIASMCAALLKHKPDIIITEKGVCDLAQHFLMKQGNCTVIRRVRKTDNNRISRVTGARIRNVPEQIEDSDIGTECGLFKIEKIGDDYFSYFIECKSPKACTVLLRGGSKDVLNEMERNFHDAIGVARNLYK
jgi:T-complex protein 1 subunit gamma